MGQFIGRDRQIRRKGIAIWDDGEDVVLYVPGEVIVDNGGDHLRAERSLDGAVLEKRTDDRLGIVHYTVRGEALDLVDGLRRERIRCGPNHVLAGEPRYKGGPATVAAPNDPKFTEPRGDAGTDVSIAVLDTGFTEGHAWLDPRVTGDGDVIELLDDLNSDGVLDDEAGHGTFIAGIINRVAPAAQITACKVLLGDGWGDEVTIASAITQHCEADIINLSLGAYTQGNQPPIGLVNALREVRRTSVVVAAAGNANTDVPFWPAALKHVYGVAAVDSAGQRSVYSNYGRWVDCATPGDDVISTFPDFAPGGFKTFAMWSGTSFAAPYLAGLVAAEMTAGGGTAADAIHRVLITATRVDPDVGAVLS